MLFSKNSGNSFFRTPLRSTLPNNPQHCPIPRAPLNDHSHSTQLRRIRRVIFNIAHFCALSNLNPKFFRFFFRSQARPSSPLQFAIRSDFEENTGSLENRYHIKYTQNPILSSRKPKISQKNPINTARFVVAEFIPPTSPAPRRTKVEFKPYRKGTAIRAEARYRQQRSKRARAHVCNAQRESIIGCTRTGGTQSHDSTIRSSFSTCTMFISSSPSHFSGRKPENM